MIRRAGVVGESGLIVGKVGGRLLRDVNVEGSVLVLAPQGAGKGVGPVVCNLLDYGGSVLCTDPKGENCAVTRRYRASLGQVHVLDVGRPEASDAFNPMDSIRWGTANETDDAEGLADLMLMTEAKADSHWRVRAAAWLTGFILHVGHSHDERSARRTLAEVNGLVNLPSRQFAELLSDMEGSPVERVAEAAAQIARGLDSDETRSILSTLVKGTGPWSRDKPLAGMTARSSFAFEDLYRQTVTVYLVVPEEKLAIYGAFLRVMTGLALNGVLRAGRDSAPPVNRPLFLLDEAAALGHLEPLENGMGYIRAYARAMLIFQDLGQLEATYRKARSMVANAATLVAFGVNDMETAKTLSERIGPTTVTALSEGLSQPAERIGAGTTQAGLAEAARPLIDASEIMRLASNEVLVFMGRNVAPPILAERVAYFRERRFRGRWDRWRSGAVCGRSDGTAGARVGVLPAAHGAA